MPAIWERTVRIIPLPSPAVSIAMVKLFEVLCA